MKAYPTFKEMSEIFSAIATAQTRVERYICDENTYNEASYAYAESDYNPGKGLYMSKCFQTMDRSRKAMLLIFKKIVKLMEADTDSYEDADLRRLSTRTHQPHQFLYAAKYSAVKMAKTIEL